MTLTITKAYRQSTVKLTNGTALPASSVARGLADCFSPNAMPWWRGGTRLAMMRSVAGRAKPLAASASIMNPSGACHECPSAAMPNIEMTVSAAARAAPRSPPIRSVNLPPGTDIRADAA